VDVGRHGVGLELALARVLRVGEVELRAGDLRAHLVEVGVGVGVGGRGRVRVRVRVRVRIGVGVRVRVRVSSP